MGCYYTFPGRTGTRAARRRAMHPNILGRRAADRAIAPARESAGGRSRARQENAPLGDHFNRQTHHRDEFAPREAQKIREVARISITFFGANFSPRIKWEVTRSGPARLRDASSSTVAPLDNTGSEWTRLSSRWPPLSFPCNFPLLLSRGSPHLTRQSSLRSTVQGL
jgi:hypothetical protein